MPKSDVFETNPASTARRGIQSVEVGGALLRSLLSARRPMMLKELAQEAGMAPGKAHPYLVSFINMGLVEQDAGTGRYRLGTFALHLGLAALASLDPVKAALAVLPELAENIGQYVALAVWGNLGPTIIHVEEAGPQLHLNLKAGTVMQPLSASAVGRCFAAFLASKQLGSMLDVSEKERRQIREAGMSCAHGQPIPGINAQAVPVFDHQGRMVLALVAIGTANDAHAEQRVREYAARLSETLGFVDKC